MVLWSGSEGIKNEKLLTEYGFKFQRGFRASVTPLAAQTVVADPARLDPGDFRPVFDPGFIIRNWTIHIHTFLKYPGS
jgi:hypothetical protein